MAVLYLIEQNTILRKAGKRLLLCKRPPINRKTPGVRESDILSEWPCRDIEHIMVFGNVQITTQAMRLLLEHDIETALFTRNGKLVGQLTPPCGKNVFLRLRQYEKYKDTAFRSRFSRAIVTAKIRNALEFLKDYARNHPEVLGHSDMERLIIMEGKLGEVHSAESLLGYEGAASAAYFLLLSKLLAPEWRFPARSRRPPKDPANAVLSFGYTVLANEIAALIDGVGMDPAVGFYHELDYGRPSLALDLLEIFRHTLIDRLMVSMFNLRILTKEDFTEILSHGGIYLSESGKRKFFRQYEKTMGVYQTEEELPTGKGYRSILQDQVKSLVRTLKEDVPFEPFRP